jgi:hypothetical protein
MIMGEPIVSIEVYMKYCLILLVAIPILLPMAEQTPNAFHSTKLLNLFIPLIYQIGRKAATSFIHKPVFRNFAAIQV